MATRAGAGAKRLLLGLCALALVQTSGCTTDATGDRSLSLVRDEDVLLRASSAAADWRERWGVYREPALHGRVLETAEKLVRQAGPPADSFRFDVLDADWPNAAAFPDGSIFVTRGMLALFNSEHELAHVLGHEIAHVMARHTLEQMNRDALLAGATLLGSALGLQDVARALVLPSYSRGAETEADLLGARYAAAAGYDAACGSLFFVALDRLREKREFEYDFFASHPPPDERLERLGGTDVDRERCADDWPERISGLPFQRSGQDYFVIGERRFVLPRIGLEVELPERPEGPEAVTTFPSRYLMGRSADQPPVIATSEPQMIIELEHYAEGVGIEWAREEATRSRGSKAVDARVERLDLEPLGERPSVRLVRTLAIRGLRFRVSQHWVQDGPTLYRVEVTSRADDWSEVEPIALAVAESLRRLDPAVIPRTPLHGRVHYHDLEQGETLETLARRYPDWDPEELAIYNPWPDGYVPQAGERVKVVRREPVAAERIALREGRRPLLSVEEADVAAAGARPPPERGNARLEGHWVLDAAASRLFPHGVDDAELRISLWGDDVEVERRSVRFGEEEVVSFRYRTDGTAHQIEADGGPHEYTSFGKGRSVRATWRGNRLEVSYTRNQGGGPTFQVTEVWRARGSHKLEVKTTYAARYGSATTREIYLRR